MANKTSNANTLQLDGYTMTPDSTEVTVLLRDPDGYILLASGTDVPSAEAGYAFGCIFIDTDATGASNIYLVNEGTTSSCSFVTGTSFNALMDTNLNPATATAGTVPCVVGGVLTAKAGLVFGTTTATSGNVLTANGTTWGTSTPDSAGLVAKSGTQTAIAGDKTWTGDHTFSGSVTFSGLTIGVGSAASASTVTVGNFTGASALHLYAGTGNIDMYGVAATTITIGKNDQTGTIAIGNSTGTLQIDVGVGGTAIKTVNIANENGQIHVINVGGTNSLPTITGSTVTIAAGTLFDVNSDMDVSGEITAMDIDAEIITADVVRQENMYWCDDFLEATNVLASTVYSKAHWTGAGTDGTQTIAADANGVIQLSTTATGNRSSTLTYSGASTFDNDLEWAWEARVKVNDITNSKVEFGMYVDGNDEIVFRFDTAVDAANIYLVTENNNAGEDLQDTGVDLVANTYFKFRIEVADDDTFEVFINDTEVCAVPTGTIRDVAFKPYFYIDNKAAAEEKILSVDYCKIWQARATT